GRLALLVDGLEKCGAETALAVARALLEGKDKAALVFVAPYAITADRGGQDAPLSSTYVHFVRAVPVRQDQGSEAAAGRSFLRELVRSRLDVVSLPASLSAVITRAAELSGGLPRLFLELVRAAGVHAIQHGRETSLLDEDLDAAAHDHS